MQTALRARRTTIFSACALLGMLLALPFWVLSAISGNKELFTWLFVVGNAIAGFLPVIDPVAILFNEDRRALHDHVAGTVVVTD